MNGYLVKVISQFGSISSQFSIKSDITLSQMLTTAQTCCRTQRRASPLFLCW